MGTGPGGRIVSKDVLKYSGSAPTAVARPSVVAASGEPYEDIPLTGMRKVRKTTLAPLFLSLPPLAPFSLSCYFLHL